MNILGCRRLILFTASALVALGGCRRSGPEIISVTGTITYGGGAWPHGGMLYFTPTKAAEGLPQMSGYAEFDAQGRFHAVSSSFSGLVPGLYGVAVECWRAPPSIRNPTVGPDASFVPPKYQSPVTSGLKLEIKPGQGSVKVHWDIPKK